ncbi:MAG: polysaccharide biosynthesis C-terminal domain-containing protein [bacterium]|nr:polysaccharide biosynthesis C-terminal domain-containing protein [bacterium]
MWILFAGGNQKILIPIYGFSMVVNILGNILLIPRYGYIAASWVTVASEGLVLLLSIGPVLRIYRSHIGTPHIL